LQQKLKIKEDLEGTRMTGLSPSCAVFSQEVFKNKSVHSKGLCSPEFQQWRNPAKADA
jgi:hypothetical protein